jgi:putative ABC transport system substrate-binding protein
MRRRQFIAGLGSAVAWPVAGRAQQPAVPVVGYLGPGSPELGANSVAAFRKGLGEMGYVEGRNVALVIHWTGTDFGRFPEFAADLVRRRVSVIVARTPPGARAAKAATAAIPIVFLMGEDPIKEGIVSSFSRPGANITGFTDFANQLAGKRLGLLLDAVPKAATVGLLVNSTNPNAEPDANEMRAAAAARGVDLQVLPVASEQEFESALTGSVLLSAELVPKRLQLLREVLPNAAVFGVLANPAYPPTPSIITDLQAAARTLGLQLIIVYGRTDSDLEPAFTTFSQQRVGAILVSPSGYYNTNMKQLVALAARHALPAIYPYRNYALAGGLMSYGTSLGHSYHEAGIYTGRILKGERPADLPVQQNIKIELVINLKTAKALGLTIPETLLATADEVIQ